MNKTMIAGFVVLASTAAFAQSNGQMAVAQGAMLTNGNNGKGQEGQSIGEATFREALSRLKAYAVVAVFEVASASWANERPFDGHALHGIPARPPPKLDQ